MNSPSLKKNYLYRLIYDIFMMLTPFITTPYISRVLSADGIGTYSYTSSVMTYFTLFASLGTASYGAREIARHRKSPQQASRLFWEIELMTVCTSLVALAGWGAVIVFSRKYTCCFIALIPSLLATMADITWFFTGFEQVKYIVMRGVFCKVLGIICLFAFVRRKDDLLLYIAINSSVQLIGSLSMWTYLPKMLIKVDFRTLTFKRHFRETWIYFVPTIATSVYTVLDKTLIGIMTGNSYQNGYYEQATKIINMIKTMVFMSLNSVMGARIAYLFAEGKEEEIHHRIERSMSFIFLIGCGCVFGLLGVSDRFVPLFFGKGYEPVIRLLYLMAPLILIIGVSNCLGSHYYTPGGWRKQSAKFIITGSLINLCLNLLLIPKLGAMGAVIASIIAELTITVLYVGFSKGYMSAGLLWRLSWKKFAAGAGMLAVVMMIRRMHFMGDLPVLILQIAVGIVTYGMILLVLHDSTAMETITMAAGTIKRISKE